MFFKTVSIRDLDPIYFCGSIDFAKPNSERLTYYTYQDGKLKKEELKVKRSMYKVCSYLNDEKTVSTTKFEVPGVKKDDLSISRVGNKLTIKDKSEKYETFTLDFDSDRHNLDTLSAKYENGILEISVAILTPIEITVE